MFVCIVFIRLYIIIVFECIVVYCKYLVHFLAFDFVSKNSGLDCSRPVNRENLCYVLLGSRFKDCHVFGMNFSWDVVELRVLSLSLFLECMSRNCVQL